MFQLGLRFKKQPSNVMSDECTLLLKSTYIWNVGELYWIVFKFTVRKSVK